MDVKKSFGALRRSFVSRSFRAGGYSLLAAALVIALAVALVLIVGTLPARYTAFDMTSEGVYSLSEQTKNLVGALEEDVDVYLLATAGSEDATIAQLLARYEGLSEHLRVHTIDPVTNPTFAKQYTDELRYNNSLIVVCGTRSRFVDYTDIYVSDYSSYYYTYNESDITTEFDGEGALTGAIDYVTSDDLPVLYALSGHGEAALGSTFARAVANANITLSELTLLTAEGVPEDCACLLINAPTADLSRNETAKLQSYLDGGGKLLLFTSYSGERFPNLLALTESYGCSLTDGIVIERDADRYVYGYYDCLLPELGSHAITSPLGGASGYVIVPAAQGITVSGTLPEGVSVEALLTTSDQSYAISDMSSAEYREGDATGPFTVGAAITAGDAQLVWFSSGLLLNEQYSEAFGGVNADLFLNAINWMCAREESISVHPKSMSNETLTLTTQQTRACGLVICILIPLGFVVTGAVVIARRRRQA